MDKGWIINEVFGLDDDCLSFVPQPTVAVIVAFERIKKEEDKAGNADHKMDYYMK
jgi:hypothetical protein